MDEGSAPSRERATGKDVVSLINRQGADDAVDAVAAAHAGPPGAIPAGDMVGDDAAGRGEQTTGQEGARLIYSQGADRAVHAAAHRRPSRAIPLRNAIGVAASSAGEPTAGIEPEAIWAQRKGVDAGIAAAKAIAQLRPSRSVPLSDVVGGAAASRGKHAASVHLGAAAIHGQGIDAAVDAAAQRRPC